MFGYKPKVTGAASVKLTFYQRVPAQAIAPYNPDYTYALFIPANTPITGQTGITSFLTEEAVDFTINTYNGPTEVTVYQTDSNGTPAYYLLKKTVKAISIAVT
jgi:hypothetical protein